MYESVGVFCPGDQLQFLRFLKEEDILIDWAKPLYINFVHCDIADTLLCLYEGTGTVEQVLGDVWACDNPRAALNDDDPDEDPKVQVNQIFFRNFCRSISNIISNFIKKKSIFGQKLFYNDKSALIE